ncbi:MAG: hypothetical protein GC200_07755 [Tepidisphaera sp.]|nr:hypothetical protein [Tepidisphaera sp.]
MKNMNVKMAVILGLVGAAAGIASAQPAPVVVTGATLFESFFGSAPQSTIDAIDANHDGIARLTADPSVTLGVQQLAPTGINPGSGYWAITYRSVGSGNGFAELVNYGTRFAFNPADISNTQTATGPNLLPGLDNAYVNRVKFYNGAATGPVAGLYNAGNPGGHPFRSDLTTLLATYASPDTPSAGGVRADLAIMDVPPTWFVTVTGASSPDATPTAAGYGNNSVVARNLNGTLTTSGGGNKLKSLTSGDGTITLNQNVNSPNQFTIFPTPIASAPIAIVSNYGNGHTQATYTELRHLFATGRLPSGENLTVVTRDSGSGTRNGSMNSLGLDPSFGVGDNVGPKNDDPAGNQAADRSIAGANFVPSNKGGSGSLERTVQNSRLALGVTGAERGANGWLTPNANGNSRMNLLAVENDIAGGSVYARPTINNLLDNDVNGYNIAGPETFASIGDPLAAPAASGGTGWTGAFDPFIDGSNGFPADGVYQVGETFTDLNGNGVRDAFNAEAGLTNTHPAVRSVYAAEYLNNISRSIQSFVSFGQNQADFTPGEYLALNFILVAATDNIPSPLDPKVLIPNPQLNQALQDNIRANNVIFTRAEYQSYNTNTAGITPVRTPLTTGTYTDGSTQNYVQQNGTVLAAGSFLPIRNKISGDFNQDGVRDANDIAQMMAAVVSRATWVAPTGVYAAGTEGTVALDVMGDFNSDGNFDSKDVRYFADGLALNASGNLDRKAAFTAVDNAFGGNYFGTTKAHGTYQNGDSRADIAGAVGTTPGYAPVGSDGTIDAKDIDYVYRQFKQNPRVTDGELNWSNLDEAVGGDLSADINGDLKINQDDITEILSILGTSMGDVNLDGTVDASDLAIAQAHLGQAGGWASGDVNGDGQISQADLDIINAAIGPVCDPDVNQDGVADQGDVDYLINVIAGGENPTNINADFNQDGVADQGDVDAIVNVIAGGPCPQ